MLVFAGLSIISTIWTTLRISDMASLDAFLTTQIDASRSLLSSIENINFQNFESFISLTDLNNGPQQENSKFLNSY
jgi:hypothetical protein